MRRTRRRIAISCAIAAAYKTILGEDFAKDPEREMQVHAEYLAQLVAEICAAHPDLAVETLLMNLDGTVEVNAA